MVVEQTVSEWFTFLVCVINYLVVMVNMHEMEAQYKWCVCVSRVMVMGRLII